SAARRSPPARNTAPTQMANAIVRCARHATIAPAAQPVRIASGANRGMSGASRPRAEPAMSATAGIAATARTPRRHASRGARISTNARAHETHESLSDRDSSCVRPVAAVDDVEDYARRLDLLGRNSRVVVLQRADA